MEMTLQIFSIFLGGTCIISVVHSQYIERVNLFQLDNVDLIVDTLKWLPDESQSKIYARGSMTRHQWKTLRRTQMREINAALGIENSTGPALLARSRR